MTGGKENVGLDEEDEDYDGELGLATGRLSSLRVVDENVGRGSAATDNDNDNDNDDGNARSGRAARKEPASSRSRGSSPTYSVMRGMR